MAEITYNYSGSDVSLYQTNLYSGSDADLDNSTPLSDTDGLTSSIDLTSKIFATIDFKFTGSGSTDDLVLKLFRARQGTHDVDEIAIDEITITSDGTEDIFSYVISPSHGPGDYRFSMQSSGASDTFDIDVQMRTSSYTSA